MTIRFESTQSCSAQLRSFLCCSLVAFLTACGGGGGSGKSGSESESSALSSSEYRCTVPAEGLMAVPPAAVLGGQIEGRSDGSFVMVSHHLWGVRHVVLMLGPDIARQGLLSGFIDAVPERLFCPSDGGLYSNGVQVLNDTYSGSNIYLTLEIDLAQGLLSGTLRDHGADGAVRSVTGGPILSAAFDPTKSPEIAAARGGWALSDAAGRPGELSVASDGSLQLKLAQCSYGGALVPVKGLNLLDMTLHAQPGCLLDTSETRGFVVLLPLADGRQQLMLWGVDDGWGLVTQAVGRR